mgnify:CR=1 FL=1
MTCAVGCRGYCDCTTAAFQLDFRISRFGVSHGSFVKTGANAQTANVYNASS